MGDARRKARARDVAQVVWTWRALADLTAIRDYIGQFSPLAAQRMALRLKTAADSLAEHPERGRLATATLRELVVVPPYVIRYYVADDLVHIVRIRHAARL
ncbi:type II toxin-antitoxin system RelE/ParE family toxin [Caulobacter vibrioides]|uniref:type II toxin-antitoxin system RelE/ParE family toxin n=1 Tax=Caulobacter vibrioides TaxID=155892 RepID=UPI000BB4D66B|nr:type II toxin-antitoxin system RelE/ParE family toxin [Caulobacter vibrioides]ATC25501.1 type II toxin-antitoxin system RelE/ParE family toxin [Caulobacter vibrioides]AZH13595.1 type II toxin-antitoxin system RelE/ParE family toxin [Caulobacter vibrioides]PLR14461.1 type II toxin-antitoxin system RelE/ParE family toxin [Caulobacter vibrioides]